MPDPEFWRWLGAEFVRLGAIGKQLTCRPGSEGWEIDCSDDTIRNEFIKLAILGARRHGFTGDDEGAVQFWITQTVVLDVAAKARQARQRAAVAAWN